MSGIRNLASFEKGQGLPDGVPTHEIHISHVEKKYLKKNEQSDFKL